MDLFEQRHLAPMLIAEEKPAFDHRDWIFELKWDGARCLAYLDPATGLHLENKRFKILTGAFPELEGVHRQAEGRCILDGELFVLENGRVSFAELQRRSIMNNAFKIQLAAAKLPASYVAFDILYLDGEPLADRSLMERKALLGSAVRETERLAVARYMDGRGVQLYQMAERQGLEGIVAKRKESGYHFGRRTRDWVKCKNWMDDDFVVCGYFFKADNLLSVVLGQYGPLGLEYQGHVVMGVSRDDYGRIKAARRVEKPVHYARFPEFEGAVWLAPDLVCKVEYMERTSRGGLRQSAFRGLRDDKSPKECCGNG